MKTPAPEISGFEFPQEIAPWQPSLRHDFLIGQADGHIPQASKQLEGEEADIAIEYLRGFNNTYIMPANLSNAVRDSVQSSPFAKDLAVPGSNTEAGEEAIMLEFEREYLGLPPINGTDTLRWWASSAGFANGTYPTAVISSLFLMEPEEFVENIEENGDGADFLITRSDDYMIPVFTYRINPEQVIIDGVEKLSEFGQQYIEELLKVYEKALKSAT